MENISVQYQCPYKGNPKCTLFRFTPGNYTHLKVISTILSSYKDVQYCCGEKPHYSAACGDIVIALTENSQSIPQLLIQEACRKAQWIFSRFNSQEQQKQSSGSSKEPYLLWELSPEDFLDSDPEYDPREWHGYYHFQNTEYSVINAIRRTLLSRVTGWSIDEKKCLEVTKNTSGFTNENIAERVSLIPFACASPTTNTVGTALRLKVDNTENRVKSVYGSDIEILNSDFSLVNHHRHIKILKLMKRDSIDFEFYMRKSCGSENARFCPVNTVGYVEFAKVHLNQDALANLTSEKRAELVERVGGEVLKLSRNKVRLVRQRPLLMDEQPRIFTIQRSFKTTGKDPDFITLEADEENILFQFDVDGRKTARQCFSEALEILTQDFANIEKGFQKHIDKLETLTVTLHS